MEPDEERAAIRFAEALEYVLEPWLADTGARLRHGAFKALTAALGYDIGIFYSNNIEPDAIVRLSDGVRLAPTDAETPYSLVTFHPKVGTEDKRQ
jgi:hypothetical protein